MCGHHRQHHRHHHTAAGRAPDAAVDDLRASDAERESAITSLRTHAGEGRLSLDELDQRIEAAYAAKTHRDLAALTADLPLALRVCPNARAGFREHLRTYLVVMALLVAIWALTGAGYFWPIWPALGWGIGLMSHASAARTPRVASRRPA